MSRNYAAEIRAIVDAETSTGPYVSRIAATEIVAKLRASDPELLDGWLNAQAEQFVWQLINDRDRSHRAYVKATSNRSVFAANAAEYEAGDTAALAQWLSMPFAVADGSRKRLATMTAADLSYVSESYLTRAEENRMTAAFLRAVGRKVPAGGTVADVFTDEQLGKMWTSVTGKAD